MSSKLDAVKRIKTIMSEFGISKSNLWDAFDFMDGIEEMERNLWCAARAGNSAKVDVYRTEIKAAKAALERIFQ